MDPALFFLKIVLAIQGFLWLHTRFTLFSNIMNGKYGALLLLLEPPILIMDISNQLQFPLILSLNEA